MPEKYISSEMRGKYRNEITPKDEISHWAGGPAPEDYRGPTKRGTSDYPKSTEGFVPTDQIPDEGGLNPEEHLLMKEEEGLLDEGQKQMWNDLMKEDIEEGDVEDVEPAEIGEAEEGATIDYLPGAKKSVVESAEEKLDKKLVEETISTKKAKGSGPQPRYYRHTKTLEGGEEERVIRGQHPAKTPKSKTQYRKTG